MNEMAVLESATNAEIVNTDKRYCESTETAKRPLHDCFVQLQLYQIGMFSVLVFFIKKTKRLSWSIVPAASKANEELTAVVSVFYSWFDFI